MISREQKLEYLRKQYWWRELINKIIKNYDSRFQMRSLYLLPQNLGYFVSCLEIHDLKWKNIAREIENIFGNEN